MTRILYSIIIALQVVNWKQISKTLCVSELGLILNLISGKVLCGYIIKPLVKTNYHGLVLQNPFWKEWLLVTSTGYSKTQGIMALNEIDKVET